MSIGSDNKYTFIYLFIYRYREQEVEIGVEGEVKRGPQDIEINLCFHLGTPVCSDVVVIISLK